MTGPPKPITMTHGTFATFDYCRYLPNIPGRQRNDFTLWDSQNGRRFYSAFPPSHLAGLLSVVIVPIFSEASSPVLGPPLHPPSGQLVKEIMEQQSLRCLFVPPAVAEQILQEQKGLEFFKGLDFMYTAGGPLSRSAGDIIARVTKLCQLYGSTETSQIPQLIPDPDDWEYMEWHPSIKLEMCPMGSDDGACELVLHMDAGTEKTAALNHNKPDLAIWPTRDLFLPHPTKQNLWRFHGRKDDIIVLSNAEKFSPVPMEIKLSGHPMLSGALVVGQGRFQPILLLEPKPELLNANDLAEKIWPLVEEANLLVPGQGRITRSKILIASNGKPFSRAAKGTIVRKLTEEAYKPEIDALYNSSTPENLLESVPALEATYDASAVEKWVRSIVLLTLPIMANASNNDDMYALGLDSLKTIEIVELLKRSLQSHVHLSEVQWLSGKTLYSNPTIRKLAAVLFDYLISGQSSALKHVDESPESRFKRIDEVVFRNTQGFAMTPSQTAPTRPVKICVAVTGTTGSLGKQIVRELLVHPKVEKICCLNRREDVVMNYEHQATGIDVSKLDFHIVRLGEPYLGLDRDMYRSLTSSVDIILHNAWKVDFSQVLESFETEHIRGVRTLVDWSIESTKHPRLIFISSVASVSNLTTASTESSISETLITNLSAPARTGYAESKYVAELILGKAAAEANLAATILRVGQIAGSTKSKSSLWPVWEWFPTLIKTSKSLNLLPNDLPLVDWIPIDQVACAIVELMEHDQDSDKNLQVYNLVNPHPVQYTSISETVRKYCGINTQMTSLQNWLAHLKSFSNDSIHTTSKPALKMLDFYFSIAGKQAREVRFRTERSETSSQTMAHLEPIRPELVELWLKQWQF